MSNEQRGLVRYWIFSSAIMLIGIYIVLSDIENKQIALIVLMILFSIVSLFQDFSHYTGYG